MSTGIQYVNERGIMVRLLENLAAVNAFPADGAPGDVLKAQPSSTQFFDLRLLDPFVGEDSDWQVDSITTLYLYETAGSGTMTLAYARVGLYLATARKAFPAGNGLDADKGKLNNAGALGETGANQLRHAEPLAYPDHFDGIQVELGTFGGTAPTYNVDWWIRLRRRGSGA